MMWNPPAHAGGSPGASPGTRQGLVDGPIFCKFLRRSATLNGVGRKR
jgi:hypothetical protein